MGALLYFFKSIVPAIFVVVGAFFIYEIIRKGIDKQARKKDFPNSTSLLLKLISKWVLGILTVLIAVTMLGVELGSFWLTVSGLLAMVAVGFFASWSLISSMLATILILIWQPYKVGTKIEILPEGIKGKVININMMLSILEDDDKNQFKIPNSQMLQKIIKLPS